MDQTLSRVTVDVTRHGPLRRLSFLPLERPEGAQVSVYRVGDVLVDTGSTRVTAALVEALRADPPRRIYLTHQHEDHVGNVGAIRDAFGALPVFAPRTLIDVIASTRAVPPYRATYWGDPGPIARDWLTAFDPGEGFEAAGLRFEAVHTPGHTPPHVAFVADAGEDVLALTGDLYVARPLDAFFEAAQDDAIRSYRALARHGARLRLLPTHGRVREAGAKTFEDGAAFLERESEAVERQAEALGTRDAITVARARYGDDPSGEFSGGEMGNAVFVRSVLDPVRTLPARPVR